MEFAAKDNFKEIYRHYIARAFGGLVATNINIKMLTLLPNKRIIGRWTLGDTLNAGGYRKVFFTLN